jgi:hypothetical protein
MDHPPYSPELAPCEFWGLSNIADNQRNVATLLRDISEKIFKTVFDSGTIVSGRA